MAENNQELTERKKKMAEIGNNPVYVFFFIGLLILALVGGSISLRSFK